MKKQSKLAAMVGAIAVSVAVTVASCTFDEPRPPTPAPTPQTVTLRIGTNDDGDVPTRRQIEEYARQVNAASSGRLLVEPVYKAAGDVPRDWDQAVARKVVSGDLEMGLIPARAWDTEGVTSLRALNAPFLVTSEAAMKAVAAPAIATEMLAGLDAIGLSGLALFPEGPRFLFSFGAPVLVPADLKGAIVRSPRSATSYALFTTLGATADDLSSQQMTDLVARGALRAAESSFAYEPTLPKPSAVTGNLVLFPKINTLVINAAVLAALSANQQRILREAAEITREWSVALLPSTANDAKQFCQGGGTVVLASEAQLAGFRDAAAPVYAELEKDPPTRALIAKLRTIAAAAPAQAPPGACDLEHQ